MDIASSLRGLSVLLWMGFVGLLVFLVMRSYRGHKVKALSTTTIAVAVAAALVTVISAGIVFIAPQERGVVVSAIAPKGYRETALDPGLHVIIPGFESVVRYPISRQTYTMSIAPSEGQIQGDDSVAARTSDGQEIFVDASVIYEIDPAQVVDIHIKWQGRYADELVRPQARGIVRDMVSQFGVEEVYTTQRFKLVDEIETELANKLQENGLRLVDFVIRNLTFSPEYAASVEQKQIAEQQAQQAAFVVEQRRQEAEQARQVAQGQADAAVIAAEGEAKAVVIAAQAEADARLIQADAEAQALDMIAGAIEGNSDLLLYNYINKLGPGIQVMLVPSENPFLLTLPSLGSGETVTEPLVIPK